MGLPTMLQAMLKAMLQAYGGGKALRVFRRAAPLGPPVNVKDVRKGAKNVCR